MNAEHTQSIGKPVILGVAVLLVVALPGGLWGPTAAYGEPDRLLRTCPYMLDLSDADVHVEIEGIVFTDAVPGIDGNAMTIPSSLRHLYRLAVVTLKITKPAGRHVSIAACDLTLHYFHGENGENTEAAPCEGISTITDTRDADRPMKLPTVPGPGFIKMTTSVRAAQASVVYMEAVFAYVEPSIGDTWICVAQPTTTAPYVCPSPAWTN
jgi:hypothetical protein